jgi:hypothetical protein
MRLRNRYWPVLLFVITLVAAPSTEAGLDIDLGGSVRLNDSTDIFFAVSSRYFGEDHGVVQRFGVRYQNPDDLAVALFITRHSGKPQAEIYRLRRQGLSWWEISIRCGVPADVWFVKVERDPGPPYGKAWGYWKKHGRDRRQAVVLTDDDCRNFVAVRMAHEYFGVPVETAMEWRSSTRDIRVLVSAEYRQRHGKANQALRADGKKHGKNNGKNKNKR